MANLTTKKNVKVILHEPDFDRMSPKKSIGYILLIFYFLRLGMLKMGHPMALDHIVFPVWKVHRYAAIIPGYHSLRVSNMHPNQKSMSKVCTGVLVIIFPFHFYSISKLSNFDTLQFCRDQFF